MGTAVRGERDGVGSNCLARASMVEREARLSEKE